MIANENGSASLWDRICPQKHQGLDKKCLMPFVIDVSKLANFVIGGDVESMYLNLTKSSN